RCRAGVEAHRLAEGCNRLLRAPLHHGAVAERRVAPRIAVVERDGPLGMLPAEADGRFLLHPSHMRRKHQRKAEQRVARGRHAIADSQSGCVSRQKSPCARATSSHAVRSTAESEPVRTPSEARTFGSTAATTLLVISSWTAKMSPAVLS